MLLKADKCAKLASVRPRCLHAWYALFHGNKLVWSSNRHDASATEKCTCKSSFFKTKRHPLKDAGRLTN